MLQARRPHFFDIFSFNFSAKRLKIPLAFVGSLQGRTSGWVSLIGPSGNTWHVDLIKCGDELFFEEGWPEFVRDNLVENGDLLVFGYYGELTFTVQVFDQSACEKQTAFNATCSQDPAKYGGLLEKRAREEGVVALDVIPFGIPKKIRSSSSDVHSGSFVERHESQLRPLAIYYEENGQQEEIMTTIISQEAKSCGRITRDDNTHIDVWDGNSDSAICRSIGKEDNLKLHDNSGLSQLAEYEEEKVVQSFQSCFPFFVRTMKRFNVSGSYTLNVPYQFAMEHLPNSKTEIVLRNLRGISWTVNSVPTTRVHTSHTFCGGWLAFVRSNEIKVGDVCIFELVHKYELRVHIFHVGKEDPSNGNNKVASNGMIVGSAMVENLQKKSKKKYSKIQSKFRKKFQVCDTNGSKMIDSKRYDCEAKKSASVALCSLARTGNEVPARGTDAVMGGLRVMLALDEEKAARSFASGYPNFARIMRKFNVCGSYTLKIPYKFSKAHLPNCKTEIILRNLQGQCWIVNSVPDSKGRLIHTFCGGWMAFIRDNDINMGDICIFELVGKWEMRVHISGVGRKGLEHPQGSL